MRRKEGKGFYKTLSPLRTRPDYIEKGNTAKDTQKII
jgi:hypothetical protein